MKAMTGENRIFFRSRDLRVWWLKIFHGNNWRLTLPHCGKLLSQLTNHSAIGVKDT